MWTTIMKIEVLQENLNKALTIAARLVSSKPQLPILSNILLSVSKNACTLTSSNIESGVTVPFGAKIENEGDILVPARIFQELIASLQPDKLTLEVKENSLLVAQSKFQGKIVCTPGTDFPKNSAAVDSVWKLPGKIFTEAINRTVFSSAVDEGRAVLNGVLFKFDNTPQFVATDGFRLSQFRLITEPLPKSAPNELVVPSKALFEVVRLLSDSQKGEFEIGFGQNNQISFKIDDISFYSQVIAGNFPDFEKIIPSSFDIKIKLTTEELLKAIKTAAIFARENANIIKLLIMGSILKVKAQGGEVGEDETEIDIEVEKGGTEEFSVSFNYHYLLDFLGSLKDEKELTIELGTSTSPVLFRSAKADNYLHIIMPVRVQS